MSDSFAYGMRYVLLFYTYNFSPSNILHYLFAYQFIVFLPVWIYALQRLSDFSFLIVIRTEQVCAQ